MCICNWICNWKFNETKVRCIINNLTLNAFDSLSASLRTITITTHKQTDARTHEHTNTRTHEQTNTHTHTTHAQRRRERERECKN